MKNILNVQVVKYLLTIQLGLGLTCMLVAWFIVDKQAAASAFLGGIAAFLPTVIFARKFFSCNRANAVRQIINNFYLGEFLKIASSLLIFTLAFVLYPVKPLVFFLTYSVMVLTVWVTPFLNDNIQYRPND